MTTVEAPRPMSVPRIEPGKPRMTDAFVKATGVAMVTSYLVDYCGRMFKSDNRYYRGRIKQLLNTLVEANAPLLEEAEKIRLVRHPNLAHLSENPIHQQEAQESMSDELETSFELVTIFVSLYLKSSPAELFDLWILLRNLQAAKKVYTQEEVDDLLRNVPAHP